MNRKFTTLQISVIYYNKTDSIERLIGDEVDQKPEAGLH